MCKRVLIIAVMLTCLSLVMAASVTAEKSEPAARQAAEPLPTKNMVHIAVIVRDIEKAAKAWADLFGLEVPKWSLNDPPEKSNIRYRGKSTEARLKTAFLKFDNLRVELMEPIGGPSTWMDFLQEHGQGVHHIAFDVKGIDKHIANMENWGMPLIQRGEWTVYTGGCYTYFESADQLGVIVELLENY
jgi:methylmalonyl-CoA/ethylmalonyl-CoA epimerase